MTGFKSLGLAGAKQAMRNLFRRALPSAASEEKVSSSPPSPSCASPSSSHPPDASPSPSPSPSQSKPSTTLDSQIEPLQVCEKHAQLATSRTPQEFSTAITTTTTATVPADTSSTTVPQVAASADSDLTMASSVAESDIQAREHQAYPLDGEDKENQKPTTKHLDAITKQLDILTLNRRNGISTKPCQPEAQADSKEEPEHDMSMFNDPVIMAERAKHLGFIGEALDMARLALRTNETPVGCVLVHDGKVIARGMNATNVTRNGTRHAEFMALCALLSYPPPNGPITTALKPHGMPAANRSRDPENNNNDGGSDGASETGSQSNLAASEQLFPDEGNEDGSKGHLYPYGQRLYPATEITPEIIKESILYVTVEPCVMCASLLRQLGIKKVYFGAVNDKFGGTGGVFSIHANSLPVGADQQTASAHPQPKPIQYPDGGGSLGTSFPEGGGDGGNVEPGYEIEGGWGRDEAVGLLRRFYVQENGRAPIPRKKEGRAARLAAMMERDGLVAFSESAEEQDQGSGQGDDDEDEEEDNRPDHDDDEQDDGSNDEDDDDDNDDGNSPDEEEEEGVAQQRAVVDSAGGSEKENLDPLAGLGARKLARPSGSHGNGML